MMPGELCSIWISAVIVCVSYSSSACGQIRKKNLFYATKHFNNNVRLTHQSLNREKYVFIDLDASFI